MPIVFEKVFWRFEANYHGHPTLQRLGEECGSQEWGKNRGSQSSLAVFQLSRSIPWVLNNLTLPLVILEEP